MNKISEKLKREREGFTLVELLVALAVFSIVILFSVGITSQVINAEIKSSETEAVNDTIRFDLELMLKELRTGNGYTVNDNCGPGISFRSTNGPRTYYLDTNINTIYRVMSIDCNNSSKAPFSIPEVKVNYLNFILAGQQQGPEDGQETVTITMGLQSTGARFGSQTSMNLEATVVSRLRDY